MPDRGCSTRILNFRASTISVTRWPGLFIWRRVYSRGLHLMLHRRNSISLAGCPVRGLDGALPHRTAFAGRDDAEDKERNEIARHCR